MKTNCIYNGDSLEVLKQLPDNSIDCCVTSPPYYALRDYGTATWQGGDPNCPHYRTSKKSDKTATGHKRMQDAGAAVGDAIYKDVCPLCGAIRIDRQIGLEDTPETYIDKLADVFSEVYRALKPDGTLWLNIGDSYWGGGGETPPSTSIVERYRKAVKAHIVEKICRLAKGIKVNIKQKILLVFRGCLHLNSAKEVGILDKI